MPGERGAQKRLTAAFFRTDGGSEPVRKWLKSLGRPLKTEIGNDLRVVEYGWPAGPPMVESVGGGLWVVRSSCSDMNEYRVAFFVFKKMMVLVHGFVKKSKKMPKADLELARRRKSLVEARNKL